MSFGSQPKSTGGGRSPGTRAHLGVEQEKHQDQQFDARLEADKERLANLEAEQSRKAAERAKLRLKVETENERRAQKDRVKRIDLAFNMLPGGSEVSHKQMDAIIAGAASIDHYWKNCGGKRAGEFKAVPLGGSVDAWGRGNDPTRYLAINSRPWHTWGLLDATEAGLPGKEFLKYAVGLFAPVFENMTGLRALVWPLHKKPNNIHPQPTMCCISPPCPRPGKQPKQKREDERIAGMLLGNPARRGRGHSPLDWALVGKPVCSLEHLRLVGFDLPSLTGDPDILSKLKSWIAYAEKNGNKALDLEAEKEWDKCILASLERFPDFRPFFDQAWQRFKAQKDKEAAAIMAEIAKDHALNGQPTSQGASPNTEGLVSEVAALPQIDASFLKRMVALQKRLLDREMPHADEAVWLRPQANTVSEFVIRPDLFLAIFQAQNNRDVSTLAKEVIDLQQQLLLPAATSIEYSFAYAAALRKVKATAARPGDERYFTPDFIAKAKLEPEAAADFLELLPANTCGNDAQQLSNSSQNRQKPEECPTRIE